jgi:methyl-accepting chemotaxis protein
MGRALVFFRQATADAATTRRKEGEQTRTLESRRQLVETATREFERAVSDIAKTLDRAAVAMDSSARDMATSATRNQEQALATSAASEQATTNVGIVATAAEEIAQSIEHIATRVANSATIASQATSEAKAITDAVESLSASVDEIGEVSDLISSIAAQTNLLALNATIEAAVPAKPAVVSRWWPRRSKALPHRPARPPRKSRGTSCLSNTRRHDLVQAINKIAATIEQLSDVANDVAVAMRQQDAVTQERRGKGHARCLRECQRGLEQRCENRKGRLDGSDRGRRTGGAISSAAAGSRALSGAGPRRFVAAAYGGRGPISSVPTNPVMLADYTAACLEPKAMQRFAPASRSGEKPDLRAWRRPIVVGTRKGVETMCGEPAADLAR